MREHQREEEGCRLPADVQREFRRDSDPFDLGTVNIAVSIDSGSSFALDFCVNFEFGR